MTGARAAGDERPAAILVAGAPALDFLNSIASPVDVPVEWIETGEDLLHWLAQANLVESGVLESIRASAGPGELDAIAVQARGLRDWFRGFVTAHMGKRLSREAIRELEPLNRLLARDDVYGQLVPRRESANGEGVGGLEFVTDRRWRSPEALLLPVAKAMADLLTTADFSDVKGCEWHSCTLLFVDTTKGRMRRWCSMAVCGNRAKQAAHRERATGMKGRGGKSSA